MNKLKTALETMGFIGSGLLTGVIVVSLVFWILSGPLAGSHYRRELQRRDSVVREAYNFVRYAAEVFASGNQQNMFEIVMGDREWTDETPFESFFLPSEGLYLELIDLRQHHHLAGWDVRRFSQTFSEESLSVAYSVKFRVIGDLPDDLGYIFYEDVKITEINGERISEISLLFYAHMEENGEWRLSSVTYSPLFF